MTRRIAHRDLRNGSSEVLRAVESGETLEVTNHGRVVAVLAPPTADPLAGIPHRAPTQGGAFADLVRVRAGETVADALASLRAER